MLCTLAVDISSLCLAWCWCCAVSYTEFVYRFCGLGNEIITKNELIRCCGLVTFLLSWLYLA